MFLSSMSYQTSEPSKAAVSPIAKEVRKTRTTPFIRPADREDARGKNEKGNTAAFSLANPNELSGSTTGQPPEAGKPVIWVIPT
jgi:hypothetical protein